jgi:recombination protein RecA
MEKSGTWMSYGETRLGQGRENVRNFLRENPTLASEIEAKVRDKAASMQTIPLKTTPVSAVTAVEQEVESG